MRVVELSMKSLEEEQGYHGLDPSLRKLSIKSSLAYRTFNLELILKVECKVKDLLSHFSKFERI